MFLNLLNTWRGFLMEADPGAAGGGAIPPATPPQGGTPPDPGGSEPPPGTNPNLVDVTALDAQGRKLWYGWEDHKKTADEAASWRKKYQDLKKKLVASDEGEGEPPAPTAGQADLQGQITRLTIQNAVIREAAKITGDRAAFIDPEDAVRLVDLRGISVEDDGTITGVVEALDALAKAKPHLLRVAQTPAAPPPPQRAPNPARNDPLTLDLIKQMTPQQIRARQKEVDATVAAAYNPK